MSDKQDVALTRLIGFLEYERRRPSSCTPDLIERLDMAVDEHLTANQEPRMWLPSCPTPCDSDCNDQCHEMHLPSFKREHSAESHR